MRQPVGSLLVRNQLVQPFRPLVVERATSRPAIWVVRCLAARISTTSIIAARAARHPARTGGNGLAQVLLRRGAFVRAEPLSRWGSGATHAPLPSRRGAQASAGALGSPRRRPRREGALRSEQRRRDCRVALGLDRDAAAAQPRLRCLHTLP